MNELPGRCDEENCLCAEQAAAARIVFAVSAKRKKAASKVINNQHFLRLR